MLLGVIQKSPEDELDYDVEFWRFLEEGEELDSVVATIGEGTTATVVSTGVNPDRLRVRLAGGEDGDSALLTLVAVTSTAQRKEICFRVRVKGC